MGLDTGCLKGGKLTAVVIEGGNSSPKHKVVHVNCKDGRKHQKQEMDSGNLMGGFALDTMQGVWDITCLRWFNERMHHATMVGVDDGFYWGLQDWI